jgi:hypothetical protein
VAQVVIPWYAWFPQLFDDVIVYREMADRFAAYGDMGLPDIIRNPFWLNQWIYYAIVRLMSLGTASVEGALMLLRGLGFAMCVYFLRRSTRHASLALVLFAPVSIMFWHGQLRNALAMGLVLMAALSRTKRAKAAYSLLAASIHIAVFSVLIPLLIISRAKGRSLPLVVAHVFGLFLAFGDRIVYQWFSDSRLVYLVGANSMSAAWLMFFVVCYCLAVLITLTVPRERLATLKGPLLVTVTILVACLGSYASGAYYSRYFAMSLPFIMVAFDGRITGAGIGRAVLVVFTVYSAFANLA